MLVTNIYFISRNFVSNLVMFYDLLRKSTLEDSEISTLLMRSWFNKFLSLLIRTVILEVEIMVRSNSNQRLICVFRIYYL